MSSLNEPQRHFFPFGNPFRMMLHKGSNLSPRLLTLLCTFEEKLAERLIKLKPKDRGDVLTLSWMQLAMQSICETHGDIKALITALELPVCDWDDKWIDAYLDNSVTLLDICIGFSSELSRINQGNLFLQSALHNLDSTPVNQLMRARSSLDGWKQHIASKNSRVENCFSILDNFFDTLNVPKIKKSSKGKVLMHAMYGVKVITVSVCSTFAAAFSGSANMLRDLQVPETFRWEEAFTSMQGFINGEIRHIYSSRGSTVLKELQGIDVVVKKLYPLVEDGPGSVEAEDFQNCVSDLKDRTIKLSEGLDGLTKEVDTFFQILLTGRDALLCNLRVGTGISGPITENNNRAQVVR